MLKQKYIDFPKLRLVIRYEFQSIKVYFQRAKHQLILGIMLEKNNIRYCQSN